MKKILVLAAVLALLGGAGFWYWQTRAGPPLSFRFAQVKRGRLKATVGSTGTLQPQEVVDVGAQVVGRIISIGEDPGTQSKIVDWGSEVEAGQVLALIDPELYKAQVASTKASVESARADFRVKTATLGQARADWGRATKLYATQSVAQAEYDQYLALKDAAEANLKVSEANIGVQQALLKQAETNLNYTKIVSPVKGTVIDRRVNVGQTVVASLSAPSLFLIAKDLRKLEVWATVNEVDVGKIKVGQDVRFTVDAYPGKTYKGKVVPQGKRAPRLNATMNQNVVTYTVVVSVDNSDLKFEPYLTASLTFIVADKKDVLLVPNAALRWQPSRQQIAPEVRDTYYALKQKKPAASESDTLEHGFVWVQGDDGYVRYIELHTGLSDSVNTEVIGVLSGGELAEHAHIIIGEGRGEAQASGANPFVAQPFAPKKKD
jgi:HlyD family secretion protein